MWVGGQILLVGKETAFTGEENAANNKPLTPETRQNQTHPRETAIL